MTLPSSSRSAPEASRISSTCGGRPVAEFGCAEPAFDDGAVGARPHPGGVGAGTAEQVQAGDHHGLAGAGLAGQHGQPAVELGGRRADRAQRLDADFGEHASTARANP